MPQCIPIIADDGSRWILHPSITKFSNFITNIINDEGFKYLRNPEIQISGTESKILNLIWNWGSYHAGDEHFEADDWDEKFLNVNNNTFKKLILAAETLEIKSLLELCYTKIEIDSKPNRKRKNGAYIELYNKRNQARRTHCKRRLFQGKF